MVPTWTPPPLPARWAGTALPAFVGRRRELTDLEAAWAAVTEGARQVVFIGGEPGAGKSRLVAEASIVLHRHGATVLLGTCIPEFGAPYQPFVEPLETLLPAVSGKDGALPVPDADASRLADQLATLLGRREERADGPPERQYQRDLYDAAARLFRAVAAQRPLVLALEDLHLAGSASLQLLTYVVEHTAESPILMLVTHRTTAADRSDQLVQAIAALYRLDGVRRLDLPGLDTDEIAQYLMREGGLGPAPARSGATILRDQTGGNPFFLRELWRDLSGRGGLSALRAGSFSPPESVRDTLHSRLQRLTPAGRRVVEVAAVIGDDFDVATVAGAASCTPQDALAGIDEAIGLGLVSPLPEADGMFRFLHSIARQTLLELMGSSRRVADHARVARVLEQRVPQTDDLVARLAHHYASAQALGLADRAVGYLVRAAQLADRSLAHRDAAGLFERAAALSTDPGQRDELRLSAAQSHFMGAAFDRARAIYEHVATHGSLGMRILGAIGYEVIGWWTGEAGRAAELLSTEMQRIERDPSDPTYVRALAGLGRALAFTGAVDDGDPLCDAAVGHARVIGDDNLLADTLEACLGYGLVPRAAQTKLNRAQELTQLAYRTGEIQHLAAAAYNRAILAYQLGDLPAIELAQADLVRTARRMGQAAWTHVGTSISYGRQFMTGDFAGAERTSAELLEQGESLGWDNVEGPHGVQMFMVRRETGALEQVRGLIRGNERPTEHWAPGLLGLYTELRLPGPAAGLLRWLLDNASAGQSDTAQWPGVLALLAEAALWLEDREAARRLRPLLADYAGLNLLLGGFDGLFGSADRYLGALDSLLGLGAPEERFEAALEMDARMDAPVHRAHTLALYAHHLRRQDSTGRAEELATQAREVAEPLGLARVLCSLPLAVGGRSVRRDDGLTARELEILQLLGEGLSNRGIARRLVISENTAANHVRSILTKTGSENRTQAAMYGRDQRA